MQAPDIHVESEMRDLKKTVDKWCEQGVGFVEKIAKIETQQVAINDSQRTIAQKVDDLESTLTKEIKNTIGDRFDNVNQILMKQQDVQARIIEVQGKQGEQIEGIRQTLSQFEAVRQKLEKQDMRLKALEERSRDDVELKKSQIQGKWALTAAIVSAIFGIVGIVLAAVI